MAADSPALLSVAGFDPCGGAGVLADVETFRAHGFAARAVVAALTAQNALRVTATSPVRPDFLISQLSAIYDNEPFPFVKLGMLGSAGNARALESFLSGTPPACLVVDPVVASSSGHPLTDDADLRVLREALLPLATVCTPNLAEASLLSGLAVTDLDSMRRAAESIRAACGCAVLIKGGHLPATPCDLLLDSDGFHEFAAAARLPGRLHGSGCRHSSALLAHLASGESLRRAAAAAREYVEAGIAAMVGIELQGQ